jgi:L-ascorbate metabolism protein UlaG (beta-lactamase superfamily)
MHLTYLNNNSWLIELAGQRILLDPWLVGPLVFGNQPWFFKAEHTVPCSIPEQIDLILLSQGLPDHAHPPTLEALDHDIPVVASPSAAKLVKKLGYSQVTALDHGKATRKDSVEIQAFPGSPIGPLLVENAFVLTDLTHQTRLYYEPHGFHSETVQAVNPVNVIITPLINLNLPLIGPFIKGGESALEVVKWLQPEFVLSTAAGGDVEYAGMLNKFLKLDGDIKDFRQLLADNGCKAQVLDPKPGQRFEVPLTVSATA